MIKAGGGKVLRIEDGHETPNPHSYPHINYTTSGGYRAALRIDKVETPRRSR